MDSSKAFKCAGIPWLVLQQTRIVLPEDQEQNILSDCTPGGKSIVHVKVTVTQVKC